MKKYLLLFPLFFFCLSIAHSAESTAKSCDCKCAVKEEDGSYSIRKGSGKNRIDAGENLKKNLKKLKCELSPVCDGSCNT